MRRPFVQLVMTCAAILIGSADNSVQAGPIGTYYITDAHDFPNTTLDAIQGSSYYQNAVYHPGEGPIAVFPSLGVVRTMAIGANSIGGEYTGVPSLTVNQDGTTFFRELDPADDVFDGTTDGKFNYTVGRNSGNVIATDTSWGGAGTVLFSFGAFSNQLGITYDNAHNSLWIQNHGTGGISEYTMSGTLLSSFAIDPRSYNQAGYTALAMDVDHTLWFANFGSGVIQHYSTSGVYLGSDSYAGLGYAWGGEIGVSAVPEPGSLMLFGLGALGLAIGRNRLRRQA